MELYKNLSSLSISEDMNEFEFECCAITVL